MALNNTQSFGTIVSNAVAAVQGAAAALVDFATGSISLAATQAIAGIALWLQGLIIQTAQLTRLATSTGSDVDTFINDYGFDRTGAVPSTGVVTLARFTNTIQAIVPAATQTGTTSTGLPIYTGGTPVQTADGTQQFQVIPDSTQTTYNSTLNAYVIPSGTSSATATVQALVAGTGGNVAANTITVLGVSVVGVDTVNNAAPLVGGQNAESDSATKAGFVTYLQSLTEGTKQACINAVKNIQTGATCNIVENMTTSGTPQAGYFYAVCDDGTGSPSNTFLNACYAAIDAVRAEGTSFSVIGPSVVTANISMTLAYAAGYNTTTVKAAVTAALTSYINTLADGVALPWSILASIAYNASPGVTNVTAVLLNSGTADLTVTATQVIKIGTVSLSP